MHIPVLKKEVLEYLDPKPNENFIDATFGFGGHSTAIFEKIGPNGRLLGIEVDPEVFKKIMPSDRLIVVNNTYANLKEIVEKCNFGPAQGILFDLGISSWDLDESKRGFAFSKDEPLDMRFNPDNTLTAEKIVNTWQEREIAQIIWEYGEERFSRVIAKRIIEKRKIKPIETTFDLIALIPTRTNPAKTFQALRIAVNGELDNLKKGLEQAGELLKVGGRIAVISFHSLEDRIVKNFFKNGSFERLNKKVITASKEELLLNSRSRSAKLRVASKK
jgi:16S rRNA (cytosine1402-N4)-methyltransferase